VPVFSQILVEHWQPVFWSNTRTSDCYLPAAYNLNL